MVYISNRPETENSKMKYGLFEANENLLMAREVTAKIKGKTIEDVLEILEKPIIMRLAESRNQITTVPIELLQSPISKTEAHLAILLLVCSGIPYQRTFPSPCPRHTHIPH